MPGGKDGQGREPPVPESPLWLPSIQPDRSGRTSPVQKVRQIAAATGTLRKEPGQLYDASTLLAEPAAGLGATGGLKGSHVPRLPVIDQGRTGRTSPGKGISTAQGTARQARSVSPASAAAGPSSMQGTRQRQIAAQQQLLGAVDAVSTDQLEPGSQGGSQYAYGDAAGTAEGQWEEGSMQQQQLDGSPEMQAAEELDPDMIPGVVTGEDVVAYYGLHGQDSPVKFFYCVRAREGMYFRPYDLLVVSRGQIGCEYYTMSATGVMHIRKGSQAEFTPLADWVRERSMFDLIRQIGYFKKYLTGRAFSRWHQHVRHKNFLAVRSTLATKLFLARPTFAPALRQIWGQVADLQQVHFAYANGQHTYSLQEYADLQVTTREQKAKPGIESIVENIQKVLEQLCREVQQQATLYQESIRDAAELQDTTGVELFLGRGGGKARPMVEIKAEKLERAANYARIMEELTQLGSFVRLADYLVVEAIMARAVAGLEDLLGLLTSQKQQAEKQSRPMFQTFVSFEPNEGMSFTPDERAVLNELNDNTMEGVVSVAQAAPRLLFMRAFAYHFNGKPSGLNTVNIIRSMPAYVALRARINEVVLADYAAVRDASRVYNEYRKIWEFGRSWDPVVYGSRPRTLAEIRRELFQQRGWKTLLDRMKTGLVVGCLQVDSKPLRAELAPIISNALEKLKLLLLNMAREATLAALDDMTQRITMLQHRPSNLDEYMAYQVMHNEQLADRKSVAGTASQIDDMYESLAANDQKVPTADQVKHDDLLEAMETFQQQLTEGKEWLSDEKEIKVSTLSKGVQDIHDELSNLQAGLHTGKYVDAAADPEEVVTDLEGMLQHISELGEQMQTYNAYLRMFEMTEDDMSSLQLVEKEANARYQLWGSLRDFVEQSHVWTEDAILDDDGAVLLNIESIRSAVEEYSQRAYKAGKANKEDQVVARLKEVMEDFKEILPLIEELANPALKPRHWQDIFQFIDAEMPESETGTGFGPFSVRFLLQYGVLDKLDKIQALSASASKEYSLEKTLAKMKGDWEGLAFRVVEYKDTGTYVVGGTDEVQALLDDQIVKTQSMRASPFIKPMEAEAIGWEELLLRAQDLLDNWLTCQATWQYLEPIFSSPDILKQMPEEGDKFQQVDTMWRDLMEAAHKQPMVLKIAADPERLVALAESNKLLEDIQKGLAAYLELKRLAFPRFFFLSNDEMLEILSETKDPTRVQPHLKKCFEGIDKLRFEPNTDITGMVSVEGELIPLKTRIKPSQANGAVEKWLVQVEAGMVESVREQCQKGLLAYPANPRSQWVLQWPGQVVLTVTAIFWTQEVTSAVSASVPGTLRKQADRCTSQLNDVVELVRGELSNLNRATLSALVVMDVHARDVVTALATEGIEGQPQHFSWLSQLRMYWEQLPEDEQASIIIRMMNAQVTYGYEYLGNSMRLVVTPLTDRCYRTLIGAVHLNMGGAPEGPAGTGKTETTKDLAKALARQCVVFNCSDTLDYLTMAKFFKGLASSGAWACFDEFNRIDLEVLSVVAQQVLEIQLAVKAKVATFTFEGSELRLRPTCNVFITMNPGYAGRSELPDNLKALFRTVAMMVPDYAMISEIMLYSSGYTRARECARKIVATYRLCSEQLSSQDHYDYGMRAVMAVLRAAGNLKRRFPTEEEFVLMLRSIIDVNLCKFLSHDVPLFNGIVSDLFPGVKLPVPDYDHLTNALKKQCSLTNQQPTDYFLLKTIQLYEMIVVRHGLMLVGQPFSGKSSSLHRLAGALTQLSDAGVQGTLFNKIQIRTINPKSVTMGQLYGESDKATQEWKDGVLAVAFRSLASDPSRDRKWLVLDGPVDAIWIESMNTVLDDNKKLCLPNSEIIAMSPTMSMIFEVGDLAAASPATVSRCGMVYLEPAQLGWKPLVASWLQTLPKALGVKARKVLETLFNQFVPACLRFVRKELKELSPSEDSGLVSTAMRIITSCLDDFQPGKSDGGEPTTAAAAGLDDGAKCTTVEGLFLFALVWSMGGTVDVDGRVKFDSFLRSLLAGIIPQGYSDLYPAAGQTHPLTCGSIPVTEGGSKTGLTSVYDYVFDAASRSWQMWSIPAGGLVIPEGASFSDIIVPTKDSARYTYLLNLAVTHGQALLMVGPTGTGKSTYVNRYLLQGLPQDVWVPLNITLSARTTSNMVQEQVDSRLDKRKKGVYGPPIGKQCVVFVDDLNMPAKEVYGAQPPIELLRQLMDQQGWYGRDNVFRQMADVQVVAAMGPPGGGRTFITNRYLRHFNLLTAAQVADDQLAHIFRTILDWHLVKAGFPGDIQSLAPSLIAATLEVYSAATKQLLPTPAKSHYLFNLRDFARIVQGMMMMPPSSLPKRQSDGSWGPEGSSVSVYKRLWVHEVLRVVYDRLVDNSDRQWLLGQLRDTSKSCLGEGWEELMAPLLRPGSQEVGQEELRRCFYGDFMDTVDEPQDRVYAPIADASKAIAAIEDSLVDYNAISKHPMALAMFLFAVEHVSRICRLLKQPGGHMLLVGVGGSGRQSLARLSAHMSGMEVFQVEISKTYGKAEWREDLKRVTRRVGAEGKRVVFLFSDTQIKDEAFLEDINNMLNAGEVPNMFPQDEKMQILEAVRPAASKQGLETPLELWGYFVGQCKKHLHIVLCMSPIGVAFRERLRANPSLVNCCTIDWFQAWPSDALEAVAKKQLREVADLDGTTQKKLVSMCQAMHVQVTTGSQRFLSELGRHNYVTPTSYLELLSAFKALLEVTRGDNTKARKRYTVGLEKLQGSADQVASMQAELQAMQPQLVSTVAEVEALMARIAHEKKVEVEPKAAIVQEEEARAKEKAAAAKAIKDECEADLSVAIPILNDALAALDTIKESDINYIKKLANPPGAIKLVMEAVCVVLDVKPAKGKDDAGKPINDYWKPSVTLLNEKDFLQRLKSYDKDNIPPKIVAAIRNTYLTDEAFTPENAKRASPAAEGMCKWVHAMSSYDKVAKVVAPKKAKLAEAEGQYEEVMVGLRAKQAELQGLLDKLASMEAELKANTRKKEQLEADIELCSIKLERADKLIGGLGGEKARWTQMAEQLAAAQVNLTGDMIISAGIIAYLGSFTAAFRAQLVEGFVTLCKGQGIPFSPKYSLATVLGDPVRIRAWLIAGLPNDSFSIENGIVVASARRWPLMIDPQGQANKWIKALEADNNLQVIKLSEGGEFMRTLENAVQFGQPVLLENVGEELDPALEPLLLKQVFKSGGVSCIRLGDSTVEYSADFRFYITTKLRNPHYLPEVAVKVTLLNFMITPAGLSDQLLGVVVATERPDLEEQKAALVLSGAENKRKLKEIEDKILEVLSSSSGNILEDESAIAIITEAKQLGNDIAAKQRDAEVTEQQIDAARVAYQPCGEYTSLLFFCISDLAAIDPMYQYSLPWYTKLFVASVHAAEAAEDVPTRLQHIHAHFTYSLYKNICCSLFEKDKLLFAFLLCCRIQASKGQVEQPELLFLLTGGLGAARDTPNPAPHWLLDKSWKELLRLSTLPAFAGLTDNIGLDPAPWQELYDSDEPHKVVLPGLYRNSLSMFRRLLLIRCIRPDKLVPAIQDYVSANMGLQYVEPPPFNLAACYADSSATTPLIFVLSPGSDPTAALLQFAAEKSMGARLNAISLGQGQGPKAAALIKEGAAAGNWVVLQNCHLAPSWMPALDKIVEELDPETTHAEFRLWMTSYPSPKFPVNILQSGIKMTNEPPKGLRANMKRSLGLEPISSPEFYEGCVQPAPYKRLLFGLVFFHAVVQERRKFGPLGWNIPYGFDDGDQRISVRQLRMFLDDAPAGTIPYAALRYVTGECNYGGRVTDDKDRLLLNTLLENCYSPALVTMGSAYSFSSSGTYHGPPDGGREEALGYIETLPINPAPEAFGLHGNADITKDINDTELMLGSLLSMNGGSGGGGASAADTDARMAAVVTQCLETLPPPFDVEEVQKRFPVCYEESLNTVLVQEMARFNKLSGVIKDSLKAIDAALKGLVVMSSELEAAFRSLCINQVPEMWKRVSYPSLRPLGSYLEDLYKRLDMLGSWAEAGHPPPTFWLSGFFFVQSFLTAGLQNYARRHAIPIDMVGYDFEMLGTNPDAYTSPASEGVYIHGLYLEGAGWDPSLRVLCESAPKVLYVPAPVMWFRPKPVDKFADFPHYLCPVYRTADRRGVLATTGHSTNFVMFVKLPSDQPAKHWVMRGLALLSGLSD